MKRLDTLLPNWFVQALLFVQKYGGYKIGHIKCIRALLVKIEDWFNNKGLPCSNKRRFWARVIHFATGNTTFYLDYENGNDSNDGSTWALAWKTITSGATAARIAPGDIIRIAKSGAPTSIGNGTWTNLSKTITLATAQNATIDLCEVAWTANPSGDVTVTRTPSATTAKQGSYSMLFGFDAAVQTSIMQAYYPISELDLSAYQKISFWILNNGAITAGTLRIALCSDDAGAVPVDYFDIPAIPSQYYWLPLTLARSGGGNLGSSIKSIALYTDAAVTGLASKYVYLDDIIACTTSGLNLQSLISKNSAEQGGTEPWLGIQSIDGTTVLLDNEVTCISTNGKGYAGASETVTTYKRETIKTSLASSETTQIQAIQDSGTFADGNIEFQGGYDTSTTLQTGETFFDGLNGKGYGLYISFMSYIIINRLSFLRYYDGIYIYYSKNITFTTIPSITNCTDVGLGMRSSHYCRFISILNLNNNSTAGIWIYQSNHNIFETISYLNNNLGYGLDIAYLSTNNIIKSLTTLNNPYGVGFYQSGSDNKIKSLTTLNNSSAGIQLYDIAGKNYLINASIGEATEVVVNSEKTDGILYSRNHDNSGFHYIFMNTAKISSEINDRDGGSGFKWKYELAGSIRTADNPVRMVLAEIPVNANAQVTVTAYCKKSHATDIEAKLICVGGQIAGVDDDVEDIKADDTDWEQLQIQFTPTEDGVVEVEGQAYQPGSPANAWFADINISQV